jgi:DNA-directed RNA polymerase II subunit RPB1
VKSAVQSKDPVETSTGQADPEPKPGSRTPVRDERDPSNTEQPATAPMDESRDEPDRGRSPAFSPISPAYSPISPAYSPITPTRLPVSP